MQKTVTRTQLVIKFDPGSKNHLYLRGSGGPLTWDHGLPLKRKGVETWTWETRCHFDQAEFKILVNDLHFENGKNHVISHGETLTLKPIFTNW